ncbi:hypothetical protein [Bacteroides reticulotermitis]|nr:hypothetical protein [Bacteroides reticulotermitis]MBB4043431.1 hypothetical protein [Bacteroides reticulotermitis]
MHCKYVYTSLLESESSGYSFLPVCGHSSATTNTNGNYWSQEVGYLNFNSNNGNKNLNTSDNSNGLSVRCVQGSGRHPLRFEYVNNKALINRTQRSMSAFRRLRSPGRVLCRPGNPPVDSRQLYVSMHCKYVYTSLLESEFSGYSFLPVCGYSTNPANQNGNYWSQEVGYLYFNSGSVNKNLNTGDPTYGMSVRCVQGSGRHPLRLELKLKYRY